MESHRETDETPFRRSSMVERVPVKDEVAGSSPAAGAVGLLYRTDREAYFYRLVLKC